MARTRNNAINKAIINHYCGSVPIIFLLYSYYILRTNNPLERLLKEVRRRTNVVGAFPDSKSALMLATARVRYISDRTWSGRRYMDVSSLIAAEKPAGEEPAA